MSEEKETVKTFVTTDGAMTTNYPWVMFSKKRILLGLRSQPNPSWIFKGEDIELGDLINKLGDNSTLLAEVPVLLGAIGGCGTVIKIVTEKLESIQ